MNKNIDEKEKARVSAWFTELRNQICKSFEFLERNQTSGPFANLKPGKFEQKVTKRNSGSEDDAGGGIMSIMREGRLFEKVGVNISTVYGQLGDAAQKSLSARRKVPGLKDDPQFWASGISLVAHMRSPKTPAVHMNTRMFWTPKDWWFGGGTDLNPCIEYPEDTERFHKVLETYCAPHGVDLYPRYKAWADEYFYVPHRKKARGVGGIFYDDHCSGDWLKDFALTKDVGRAFLPAYLPLLEERLDQSWDQDDRERQLIHRGLYAEYNLIYDRGTRFGLETGHDPDAVLMSLPPLAKWI